LSFVTNRMTLAIEWAHCDPAGIVFNPRFYHLFDTSTWAMFAEALGIPVPQINATYGLVGIALVDVKANFMKPARFGDTIEIASHVREFRKSSFVVEHKVTINGELAIEGEETRVWAMPRKDDPDKMRTGEIPAEVIAKFG
jgi:4-hydroxybenzoyl-CoA thioesterase